MLWDDDAKGGDSLCLVLMERNFLSLSTRDSPQLKTENSIPYIFWRSSKDCVATAIKSSSGRHKMFWRSLKDNLTLENV